MLRQRIGLVCFPWLLTGAMVGCGSSAAPAPSETTLDNSEPLRPPTTLAPFYRAPAGNLPTTRDTTVDGVDVAVLPNGRLLTPAGFEANVTAPKPFGLALSPDGKVVATVNSGASRFSVTLIRGLAAGTPDVKRIDIDATFMGIAFSKDGSKFFASGGENGNIWVGDTALGAIVGSVNLNGTGHPLDRPLAVNAPPALHFKGAFPGNLVLSHDGRFLYVVDQASFQVHVVDTTLVATGLESDGRIHEPDNFAAVVSRIPVGRYPYGLALDEDSDELFVTHVGTFEYTHLTPPAPTGDSNHDYPLCYPGVGYPDETLVDRLIKIKHVDPRALPETQRDPAGIRCGYVPGTIDFVVPGLGDPNVAQASSVYAIDVSKPTAAKVERIVHPGPLVGESAAGIPAYSGAHPNAVAVADDVILVANGNDDSISILSKKNGRTLQQVALTDLEAGDRRLRGVQPVSLALSPDEGTLYVAEAGINAIGVVRLHGASASVEGHIPVGFWPSSVRVSPDGKTLFVANAKGRGAGPDNDFPPDNLGSPKTSTMGTVNAIRVPSHDELRAFSQAVLRNNGFTLHPPPFDPKNPIPSQAGVESRKIRHVVFINKENATHDLLLGDITASRKGEAVNGEPRYSLGTAASPNHHELALSFAFCDNFYLEPSVSSDGHRWLTDSYTTEFEETHWPASYGGRRQDSGDNPAVYLPYPGRLGFTDANSSPEPNDYDQHGGIFLHLDRNGKSFANFGNGYEFAIIDEDGDTEPTGAREHVNVPMEKVVRDHSDHLFPTFNTHIPDAPLDEDPGRFNRFGRFKQVFEAEYVDRASGRCKLPEYVDLYYPNDHGGGARDIHPNGPDWSFTRFVQDNDAALGLTVDLISHSPCWKDTVIFVVEDDTQNGLDHVDGHRSIFLAISPWVKREHVSHLHTSLASIFKTVDLVFGIAPLNQYDAAATDLRELFTDTPDFTPYTMTPVTFSQPNPLWRAMTRDVDFSRPDSSEAALRRAVLVSEGLPRKVAKLASPVLR
jgi:DNA-binding beta-propeller fold protein YncE